MTVRLRTVPVAKGLAHEDYQQLLLLLLLSPCVLQVDKCKSRFESDSLTRAGDS